MARLVAIDRVAKLHASHRRARSPENRRVEGRGWSGRQYQRDGGAVLARLLGAASQDQSDKSKVFHNPAASSGFPLLARGL